MSIPDLYAVPMQMRDFALMLRRSVMHKYTGKPHVYRESGEWHVRDERGPMRLRIKWHGWRWFRRKRVWQEVPRASWEQWK